MSKSSNLINLYIATGSYIDFNVNKRCMESKPKQIAVVIGLRTVFTLYTSLLYCKTLLITQTSKNSKFAAIHNRSDELFFIFE